MVAMAPSGPVVHSIVDSVIGFGASTKAAGSHSVHGEPLGADDDTGRQPDLRAARDRAVPHPRPVKEQLSVTGPSPLREGPPTATLCDRPNKSSGGSAAADEGDTAENHGQGSESAAECEGGSDDADQ